MSRKRLLRSEVGNLVDVSFAKAPSWLELREQISGLKPRWAIWLFRFFESGEVELAQRMYDAVPLLLEAEAAATRLEEAGAFTHLKPGGLEP